MFRREIALLGEANLEKIQNSNICLFGLGGVGSYIAEILIRCGIKKITIVDYDKVSISNKNRQLIALDSTLGEYKTDVLEKRLKDINNDIEVTKYNLFINEETLKEIKFNFDYVIDAVDNITAKINIIKKAKENNIKIISSMGTGNKLDPLKFMIKDINQTKVCPLAKVMRHELRKLNIKDVPVLYSEEEPLKSSIDEDGKIVPSSIAFTPSIAGILIARYIILDIIK